jgi:predicted nucleic acid-binding Zn ribbon protein
MAIPNAMDQAAKLLAQFQDAARCLSPAHVVAALWPRAVGKTVAAHSRVDGLWKGLLHVSVDDDVWREHLTTLASQIVSQLNKTAGGAVIREVRFRTHVPKRPPGRAVHSSPRDSQPSADPDGIADPVLGRIYRASRKRAGAR